jgi:hypothetical protein
MKDGYVVLYILGIFIILAVIAAVVFKPPEFHDRFGELGKRKQQQESRAASPSATPQIPSSTPSASPEVPK